jgi:hypothetical protein
MVVIGDNNVILGRYMTSKEGISRGSNRKKKRFFGRRGSLEEGFDSLIDCWLL